jgi:hypothetical protein
VYPILSRLGPEALLSQAFFSTVGPSHEFGTPSFCVFSAALSFWLAMYALSQIARPRSSLLLLVLNPVGCNVNE